MKFNKILRKSAKFQVEHPYLTIGIILAITIIFLGGASKVRTVASLEQMMPKNIEEVQAFNELRDNNLGQDMIGIVIEVNRDSTDPKGIIDIRTQEVYDYVLHLKELVDSNPDIRQSYSYTDTIQLLAISNNKNPYDLNEEDFKNYMKDEMINYYVSPDYTTAIIIAVTDVSADDERMKGLANKLVQDIESVGHPPGIKVSMTGTPIIQQRLGVLIAKDRNTTQWLSTLFVFLITMLLFGTFTSAIVPIIIVTISVNWLYGIMGYANLPISTLAGGVAAMVIGIGIDYSIHLMNKFKYERKEGKSIEASITKAIEETGTALTGAAIATIIAFLAFLLGNMPEMNKFGLLMSIGVSSAFILSIFGLPALLIIEEKIFHKLSKRIRFGVEGEFMLCDINEIHPENHKVADVTDEDLRTLKKKYKVVRRK